MYRQTEELYLPHRKAEQMNGTISKQALRRLPFYLDYLKKKQTDGVRNISATTVANDLKLNEVPQRPGSGKSYRRQAKNGLCCRRTYP